MPWGIFTPNCWARWATAADDPTACLADKMAWPRAKALKARISLTTTATAPNTRILAVSTTGRRGTADNVARMVPVPYSALMTSTPRTPKMSWPRKTPIRLRRVGSSMMSEGLTVPVPSAHKPTTATAVPTSVHVVERTDQSLVHSAAMARRRPTRPGGSSMLERGRSLEHRGHDPPRNSTASSVSSMKASSSEATGVSSCRASAHRRSQVAHLRCGQAGDGHGPVGIGDDGPARIGHGVGQLDVSRRAHLDRLTRAAGHEVSHRGLGDHLALADDHQMVGGERHLGHEVARHEHGATLTGQLLAQRAHPPDALGIEAVHRLVEQQHPRVAEQGGGDAQALAHAERELAHPFAGHRGEAHELQHLVDATPRDGVAPGQGEQMGTGGATGMNGLRFEEPAHFPQRPGQVVVAPAQHGDRCPTPASRGP